MATLLRPGVAKRLIGGSMVQRAQAAVAEERRRQLVSRASLMHTKKGAGEDIKKGGGKSMFEKWREGPLAFERFDEALTNVLHFTFGGLFSVCAILTCKDTLVEKWKAQNDKK